MKKFWVLLILFILPLVFYIFLSEGIYKYSNLPILTNKVSNIDKLDSKNLTTFSNKLTIVCFPGADSNNSKTGLLNRNEVIYKRYYQKPFFQIVALLPKETKEDYKKVIKQLGLYTNLKSWHFIFTSSDSIQKIYQSFKVPKTLNQDFYTPNAFIIDKKLRLRGRKDDEDMADGKLYGFNMNSVAVLKNKMKDDIDIIYYQYKKSAEKEKRNKNNQ
jgi:hypothetical protein